jgi:hypothetical protein
MGIGNWLRKWFGGRGRPAETVPYFDVESKRVVRIPPSELRPGVVQVRIEGIEEVVWVSPEQLRPGEIRHPPFDEEVRAYIRQIREAFAEQRPLSFEEWEDGFRRDGTPEREIAIWSHAADVYTAVTAAEDAPERRRDVYRVIVACMTTSPDTVWRVLRPEALTREEAQQVIDRFYGRAGTEGG